MKMHKYLFVSFIALIQFTLFNDGFCHQIYEPDFSNLDDKALTEKLKNIPNLESEEKDTRVIIHEAAKRRNPAFSPMYKKIAETWWQKNEYIAFDALYALWKTGEDRTYFRNLALNYKTNKVLAYYAIIVLSYDPDDKTMEVISKINEEIKGDFYFGLPIGQAETVYDRLSKYAKIEDISKKVQYLVVGLRSQWTPKPLNRFSPHFDLYPLAVWAQERLLELSKKEPDQVAKALIDVEYLEPERKSLIPEFKEHVKKFITDECRKKLDELLKEK